MSDIWNTCQRKLQAVRRPKPREAMLTASSKVGGECYPSLLELTLHHYVPQIPDIELKNKVFSS